MDEVYSLKINCVTHSNTQGWQVLKLWGCVQDTPNVMKFIKISIPISLNNEELNTGDMDEVYSLDSTVQPKVIHMANEYLNFKAVSKQTKYYETHQNFKLNKFE